MESMEGEGQSDAIQQHLGLDRTALKTSKALRGHSIDRHLIYAIGDEDTVTGLLLAGIGNKDALQQKNFFIVDSKTPKSLLEETFKSFMNRKDIAILLINQHIAEQIRQLIEDHHDPFPALLEIPSKDHPYDPEKDTLMKRVEKLYSND